MISKLLKTKAGFVIGLSIFFVMISTMTHADDGNGLQANSQTSAANGNSSSNADPSTSFMANPTAQPQQNQAVVLQAQPVPQTAQVIGPVYTPPPPASLPPPARKKTPGPMNYLVGMFKSLFGH